jgi:hypothetical protein
MLYAKSREFLTASSTTVEAVASNSWKARETRNF